MPKIRKIILKIGQIFLILILNLSKNMLEIRENIPKIRKFF